MECADVGEANPDISGVGLIVSFAAQAGISIILALWTCINALVNYDVVDPRNTLPDSPTSPVARPSRFAEGDDASDGGYASDGRALSPVRVRDVATVRLRAEVVEGLLTMISDIQTANGISLLIAAVVQHKSLTLYHYRIVYDIVNFTGVSFCAALANHYRNAETRRTARNLGIATFAIFYLTYAILYGRALGEWDPAVSGRCYLTKGTATPGADHPVVDRVYLGITAAYLSWCLMMAAMFNTPQEGGGIQMDSERPMMALIVLSAALLQYTLHLYMVVTMRTVNKPALGGDSEDSWGFGQVAALVLLGATLLQCVEGAMKLFKPIKEPSLDDDDEEEEDLEMAEFETLVERRWTR